MNKIILALVATMAATTAQADKATHTCSLGGWFDTIEFTVYDEKSKDWTEITSRTSYTTLFGDKYEKVSGIDYKNLKAKLKSTNGRIRLTSDETTYKRWETDSAPLSGKRKGLPNFPDIEFEYEVSKDKSYTIRSNGYKNRQRTYEIVGYEKDFSSSQGSHYDTLVDEACEIKFSK